MHPKRKSLFTALFLLLLCCAGTLQARSDGPAVWQVDGGEADVVIMGSVHLLRPGSEWLRPHVRRRFDEASVLVLEIADVHESRDVTMRLIAEKGFYPPGTTLASDLDPELYERAVGLAQDLGVGASEFAQMRPWLAGIVLTQAWAARHGFDPGHGVDLHFSRRAAARDMRVIGLETAEEQLSMLIEGMGHDAGVAMEQTLEQLEDPTYMAELIDAWLTGDTAVLGRLIEKAFAGFPEAYEVLIAARNRRWADTIEALLARSDAVFVVVGAAHVVGPDNLIDLLRDRGYRVTRR